MVNIVLAGGGTAGHTSPLIATAKAIQAQTEASLVVIGTSKGLETRVVPEAGLELRLIDPVPFPRRPGMALLKLPLRLAKAVRQARKILRETQADALVGFGGYVSIPAYLAAWLSRVPVVVHEANKLPGLANKVGARFAVFVAITFAETRLPGAQLIGMPIKRSITHPEISPAQARAQFGLDPDRPTLLVSGGSQGAASINRAVREAREDILAAGIQILHVLGPKNMHDDIVPSTHASGAGYQPVAFVADMALAYAAGDLMLGRAGAGTVMETAISGLPVIFVPLPFGNGEQGKNAAELVAANAGVLVPDDELTASQLRTLVLELFGDPNRLATMAAAASHMYPADAAETLAAAVLAAAKER